MTTISFYKSFIAKPPNLGAFLFLKNVLYFAGFLKAIGPIVYQLGHKIFNLGSRVRLPVGSQRI
jgi:hypothetical protein